MKAIHVNTHLNIGGIGQYITSLSRALKPRGITCVVVSSGGGLEEELKASGIKHIYADIDTKFEFGPKVFKLASCLGRIIIDEGADILHAHTRVSQVASLMASRKRGIPYVSTCHGFFKPRLSRRLFDSWGDKVIAISGAVKGHLQKDFNVDGKRIEVIHTGIDPARFQETYPPEELGALKVSLGLTRESVVIGTMGRLSSVKGQRFLIEAMKHVISKRSEAQCLIIGSGPEERYLKELASSLGIEKDVKFCGSAYTEAPAYLACIDIFVLPSVNEGLGLALLEAMSAGRPCVASDVGGVSDIVEDGSNGLLVPVGDIKAIASSILRLIDDRALRGRFGAVGRALVKEKFSLDSMAGRIASLYKEVIRERK